MQKRRLVADVMAIRAWPAVAFQHAQASYDMGQVCLGAGRPAV